jgi:histidine kinase
MSLHWQYRNAVAVSSYDKFPNIELECRVYAPFNVIVRHWKEHIRETIIPLMEGAKIGLIAGNLEYAGICSKDRCTHLFIIGEELEHVDAQFVNSLNLLREIKQEYSLYYAKIWRQLVLNLMGRVEDKSRLIGESFDEVEMLPYLVETNNRTSVFSAYLAKGILCYWFKDYAQSLENFDLAVRYVEAAMGFATVGTLNFYQSLAMLALYPTAETSDSSKQNRTEILQQVQANQKTMKQWVYHAPMNYQHKSHLVEAEKARVLNNKMEAIDYYDLAIKGAAENGYIQEEALAYELAGEFYQSLGKEIIAQAYMTKAYYAYIRWGAIAKVKDLESRYPYLVNRTKETTSKDIAVTTTSTTIANAFSLDLSTVVKASQALSSEIVLERLLEKLMHLVGENAGAQKVFFIAKTEQQYVIEASLMSQENVTVLQSIPIGECDELPRTLINYVGRTQTPLVLDDATGAEQFNRDPYIVANQPLSVLVSPVLHQGKLTGIFYLENNLTPGAFTSDRLKVLGVLSAQAAISLENARFYTDLETRVAQRTQELQTALEELRRTQLQLIQSEKMSSLGQLVGGIAHEINNPINFIYGNLSHADDYAQSLLELLHLYQEQCPNPSTQLVDKIKNIDLEYIKEDLPKILNSMHVGARRIRDIVQSLRNFARLDEAARKAVNLHEGLDSTLMVLQQKLGKIQVVKEYGNLPLINCYAGELNQVFMNLLANAIDALSQGVGSKVDSTQTPTILLKTEVQAGTQVVIRIADNGVGMKKEVLDKIFDPFFTTKPVGKGTGLGLSISYQIVVEQHRGELLCKSAPGEGTEFAIALPLFSV